MEVDMSAHFTTRQLLRYALPTIGTLLFVSIYAIVDGLFVSNFAGTTAYAAVSLIMPFIMILGGMGFMFGTGGSAIISITRGEGKDELANNYFSLLVYAAAALGIILAVLGAILMPTIAQAMGAEGEMEQLCVIYGRISMISLPAYVLQFAFQTYFITAGKPHLGFLVTFISGCMNIIFDFLFVGLFRWGVAGAAIATVISEFTGTIIPLIYFARPNSSFLRLGAPSKNISIVGRACINGSSEMVNEIAISVVSIVYNFQLLAHIGEGGVAAYGIIQLLSMIFGALILGYAVGTAPLMSFQYGAQNHAEMRSLFRKNLRVILVSSVLMTLAAEVSTRPLALAFLSHDPATCELTIRAFRIYILCFLLFGFNNFGGTLFTSLENGLVSALISFCRTLIFELGAALALPALFGIDAIWFSPLVSHVLSLIMVVAFFVALLPRYGLSNHHVEEGRMKRPSHDE